MDTDGDELLALRRLLQDVTEKLEAAVSRVVHLEKERNERILHVFGCAGCGGEHRSIWTQQLKVPVAHVPDDGSQGIKYQRAYVCPDCVRIVIVSNESEETVVLRV